MRKRQRAAARPDAMEVLAWWDDWMAASNYSEKTRHDYGYAMLRVMSHNLGTHPLELSEQQIVGFLGGLGKRAHSKVLYDRGFRCFFGWADHRGLLEGRSPVELLRPRTPVDPPPEAYSPEELVRILVAASWRDQIRGWALLACFAIGARRNEFVSIREEDVDFDQGRIYLRYTKGNRPRVVPMNDLAREAFTELLSSANDPGRYPLSGRRRIARTGPLDTRVLPIAPATFSYWVHEAGTDCGFPAGKRRRAHTLRSTFATMLDHNGTPAAVIQRLLGHQSVATTTKYLGVFEGDARRAVDSLSIPESENVVPLRPAARRGA